MSTANTQTPPIFSHERLCGLWETAELLAPASSEILVIAGSYIPHSIHAQIELGEIHIRYIEGCGLDRSLWSITNFAEMLRRIPGEPFEFEASPDGEVDNPRLKVRHTLNGDRCQVAGATLLSLTAPYPELPIKSLNPAASNTNKKSLNAALPARSRWLLYEAMLSADGTFTLPELVAADPEKIINNSTVRRTIEQLSETGLIEQAPERGKRGLVFWRFSNFGRQILEQVVGRVEEVRVETSDTIVDPELAPAILEKVLAEHSFSELHQKGHLSNGHFEAGHAFTLNKLLGERLREYNGKIVDIAKLEELCGSATAITALKLDRMLNKLGSASVLIPYDIVDRKTYHVDRRRWRVEINP